MDKKNYKIDLNGIVINYELKKYAGIRYMRLRMEREHLVVTVPNSLTIKLVEKFILSKEIWIKEQILRQQNLKYNGLLYKGIKYDYEVNNGSKGKINLIDDKIIIETPETHEEEKIIFIIKKWYVEQFKILLSKSLERYAELLKVSYNKVTIKEQKTRWGSCSSKKNLNFNWKLIMAPTYVTDYIVAHELCHLIHMNHSKSFWAEVKKIYPEYKKAEMWLKQNHHMMYINYKGLS